MGKRVSSVAYHVEAVANIFFFFFAAITFTITFALAIAYHFLRPVCSTFNFQSLFLNIYLNVLVSNFNLMNGTNTAINVTVSFDTWCLPWQIYAVWGKNETVMTDLSKCYFRWHVGEFPCYSLKGAWNHCHTHFTQFCSY